MFVGNAGRCEDRLRRLLVFVLSSPKLPLLVELVAGGEGRPEEDAGLDPGGGSGSFGKSGGEAVLEVELELRDPMKIADEGRSLRAKYGRGVIGRRVKWGKSSRICAGYCRQ